MATLTSSIPGDICFSNRTVSGARYQFPNVTIPSGATLKSWKFRCQVDRPGGYAKVWSSDGNHVLGQVGSGGSGTWLDTGDQTDFSYIITGTTGTQTPWLGFGSSSSSYNQHFYNGTITITYEEGTKTVTTAVSPAGSGTLTASKTSAVPGTTVTLTPTAATGYHFSSYTSNPTVTITNNSFTMPSQNVTITANFAKQIIRSQHRSVLQAVVR